MPLQKRNILECAAEGWHALNPATARMSVWVGTIQGPRALSDIAGECDARKMELCHRSPLVRQQGSPCSPACAGINLLVRNSRQPSEVRAGLAGLSPNRYRAIANEGVNVVQYSGVCMKIFCQTIQHGTFQNKTRLRLET